MYVLHEGAKRRGVSGRERRASTAGLGAGRDGFEPGCEGDEQGAGRCDAELAEELCRLARAGDEVRYERVAELRAAIAEGRYRVGAEAVAERLMAAGWEW